LRDAVSDDEELRLRAVGVLKDHEVYGETAALLEDTLDVNPRHVPSLLALSDAAQRHHDLHRAAMASAMLICLQSGRTDDEERSKKFLSDGLPLAKRILNNDDFQETLLAKPINISLFRTLSQLSKVVVASGLVEQAGNGALPKDATALDPAMSTTTLARSLAWAARFVNVNTPELVVMPELPTHMELVATERPRLLIAKQLGSGLSLAQLAFLGSRHLCMLRPELKWRAVLSTPESLASAIGFCVGFAREGDELVEFVDDVERRAAKRFVAQLEADDSLMNQVRKVFHGFQFERSECERLARQSLKYADRAVLRVGLLACANPSAAWKVTTQYPLGSLISMEEQLDEIARFATSRDYTTLRADLALEAGPG
jgi:hypothetical protein